MAYQNTDPNSTNPYGSDLRADPQMRAAAGGRSRGSIAGILVVVLLILGLIVGIGVLGGGDDATTPAPATTTGTAPEAAPAAPMTEGNAAPAPAPPAAPAD